MEIAINFGRKGIIVEIGCGNENFSRFFDCSVLSRYANEEERLLFDHRDVLPFLSILRIDLGHNYRGFVKAMALLKGMCEGRYISGVGLVLGPHRIAQLWRLLGNKFKIQESMFAEVENERAAAMFCEFLFSVCLLKKRTDINDRSLSVFLNMSVNCLSVSAQI